MLYIDEKKNLVYFKYYSESKRDHEWRVFNGDFGFPSFDTHSEAQNIEDLRYDFINFISKFNDIYIDLSKKDIFILDSIVCVQFGSFLFLSQFRWRNDDSFYRVLIINLKTGKIIYQHDFR